jgi:hypothetical protein
VRVKLKGEKDATEPPPRLVAESPVPVGRFGGQDAGKLLREFLAGCHLKHTVGHIRTSGSPASKQSEKLIGRNRVAWLKVDPLKKVRQTLAVGGAEKSLR